MTVLTDEQVAARLSWDRLIPALRTAFAESSRSSGSDTHTSNIPARASYGIPGGHLLAMPAWGAHIGIKIATILPASRPSVQSTYLLLDARTGERLAVMSANALTRLRTAATSALASSFLSRPESSTLLMVGAGEMAGPLISAHVHVRSISRVLIWNRTPERALALSRSLRLEDTDVHVVDDLPKAVSQADIISAATLSTTALIEGADVGPGTHVDLVGAFTPDMRETDSALMAVSRLFVDDRESAFEEAGDVIQAVRENVISADHVLGDLFDLCSERQTGRRDDNEITVFKSVGHALEDLVAGTLVMEGGE